MWRWDRRRPWCTWAPASRMWPRMAPAVRPATQVAAEIATLNPFYARVGLVDLLLLELLPYHQGLLLSLPCGERVEADQC